MLETITDKDFGNLIGSKVDKDIADFLQERYNILDTLNSTYFDEDMFTMFRRVLRAPRQPGPSALGVRRSSTRA